MNRTHWSVSEVGDIYSVWTDFCFRMPDLRRLDEEVDELMGSGVPTTRGTSACASEKKSVREAAALPVKQVTAEVRRVTLKRSSVSLENKGSKKRKSREHECKLCSAGTFISTPVICHAVRHHLHWFVVPDTACWTCKRQYGSSGQLKKHVDEERIQSDLDHMWTRNRTRCLGRNMWWSSANSNLDSSIR